MSKLSILFILVFLSSCCEDRIEECPCFADQQNPIYKGCDYEVVYDLNNDCAVSGLYKQLYDVIVYPPEAREDSIEGLVTVTFDVYIDGSIGNYMVINDTLGHGLPGAAIDAIKTLNIKGFCPARDNCTPVDFTFTLPILFVLE